MFGLVNSNTMAGREERIPAIKSFLVKYKFLILWIVLSVILTLIGFLLLGCTTTSIDKHTFSIDYTRCKVIDPDFGDTTCQDYLKENKEISCKCYYIFDLSMKGKVMLSYELPDFNQTSTSYTSSKDDDQLQGILRNTPSANCEPYQYHNGKPIAPCGAIADSMLFDYVYLLKQRVENKSATIKVPLVRYGMLSAEDKAGFHNPQNLTQALQNFTKPIHWPKNIYELDLENEDNNGFQNEYFISWMRTDWKSKPIALVNHDEDIRFKEGLPNATYQVLMEYYPSPPGNDGSRILVLTSDEVKVISSNAGFIVIIFGMLMAAASAVPYSYTFLSKICSDSNERNERARAVENVYSASPKLLNKRNNSSSAMCLEP